MVTLILWIIKKLKRKPKRCLDCVFWDSEHYSMKNYPFERCECHVGPEYTETRRDWWCSHFRRR